MSTDSKIEWTAKTSTSYAGYALFCPDRDYKMVYMEQSLQQLDPKDPVKSISDNISVESLDKFDGMWVPTKVHYERVKRKVDDQIESLTEEFRLIEFQPNSVDDSLIFEPQASPGTRVYHGGATGVVKAEVAGGDVLDLVRRLQRGDFSALKEDVSTLSPP